MYAGKIVEQADTRELFENPLHPYTRGLMGSLPRPGGSKRSRLATIPGTVPRLSDLPAGCGFAPRCDRTSYVCENEPALVEVRPGHSVRCWKTQ
jgi:peptide/nickel transport system ATP-binding protein